jgi:hypothetical protein
MKFELTTPCKHCPFRNDIPSYLTRGAAEEISYNITEMQQTFACHKTTGNEEDEEGWSHTVELPDSQHCAGASILLMKINRPNQMMQVLSRLGMYDYKKLKMDSPVFNTVKEFIGAQRA